MKRILFLVFAVTVMASCSEKKHFTQTYQAPIGDIRALHILLGGNVSQDWPTQAMGDNLEEAVKFLPEAKQPSLKLVAEDSVWRKVTDYAAQNGVNTLVVEIAEALQYPSHPELAVEGSWSPKKMQEEVKRLNDMGMEVIPLLNFSSTHNGWLKDYRHMVSSATYYKVCSELIADVMEIFGHPRFFHIGYDEEEPRHQKYFDYQLLRIGETFWKDFLFIVDEVEKHGARAWVWGDYVWHHPEFLERCPKSVIVQNWYYDAQNGGFDLETNNTVDKERLYAFWQLEEAGFDQVPAGTNWVGKGRREQGVNADDVIGKLVQTCRNVISSEHLYGFAMTSWVRCTEDNAPIQLSAIELFHDALN